MSFSSPLKIGMFALVLEMTQGMSVSSPPFPGLRTTFFSFCPLGLASSVLPPRVPHHHLIRVSPPGIERLPLSPGDQGTGLKHAQGDVSFGASFHTQHPNDATSTKARERLFHPIGRDVLPRGQGFRQRAGCAHPPLDLAPCAGANGSCSPKDIRLGCKRRAPPSPSLCAEIGSLSIFFVLFLPLFQSPCSPKKNTRCCFENPCSDSCPLVGRCWQLRILESTPYISSGPRWVGVCSNG